MGRTFGCDSPRILQGIAPSSQKLRKTHFPMFFYPTEKKPGGLLGCSGQRPFPCTASDLCDHRWLWVAWKPASLEAMDLLEVFETDERVLLPCLEMLCCHVATFWRRFHWRRILPSHRGVIKRSPGDLLMFCFWVVGVPQLRLTAGCHTFWEKRTEFWDFGVWNGAMKWLLLRMIRYSMSPSRRLSAGSYVGMLWVFNSHWTWSYMNAEQIDEYYSTVCHFHHRCTWFGDLFTWASP